MVILVLNMVVEVLKARYALDALLRIDGAGLEVLRYRVCSERLDDGLQKLRWVNRFR